MSGIALVYALFADRENARATVQSAIEDGLAACANILAPCTSFYYWEGALQESSEIPVIFKTTSSQADNLIERIGDMHPYTVPAIVSWPIVRAPAPFAAWVNEQAQR